MPALARVFGCARLGALLRMREAQEGLTRSLGRATLSLPRWFDLTGLRSKGKHDTTNTGISNGVPVLVLPT